MNMQCFISRIALLVGMLVLTATPKVEAQLSVDPPVNVGYDACRNEMDWLGWREQREFRAALFGLTAATGATLSEVRFADDRSTWIKTRVSAGSEEDGTFAPATWESVAPGYESTTWPDETMNANMDLAARKGIFQVRRRPSTQLIPHLTQAYRTLECRLEELCRRADLSLTVEETAPQDITVKVLGCLDMPTTTIAACHLASKEELLTTEGNLRTYCRVMIESLRVREAQILKLVVEYDAGYRSGIQFSGIFRSFLGQMRGVVLGSIRSATQMITSFSRIPCFVGSCDSHPPSFDPAP